MTGATVEHDGDGRVRVAGILSFATVPDTWKQVRPLLRAAPELRVDLGQVTRSDSAGLAFLVECLREAKSLGKEIAFVKVPDQMLAIAQVSGLDRVLPLSQSGLGPRPRRPPPAAEEAERRS